MFLGSHASGAALRRSRALPSVLSLAVPLLLAAGGCGDGDDVVRPNRAPAVELLAGPVEGGEASYAIRTTWTGTDPDGYVAYYRYAMDPPPAFSESEIAQGGSGITTEFLAGGPEGLGLTRVSKVVDGSVVSFDWVHTRDFSRRFLFSTTDPDSLDVNGERRPAPRFSGTHALYLQAVDDNGLASAPDRVAFTATTVTPRARIVGPRSTSEVQQFPGAFRIGWDGFDPDGYGSGGKPVAYEYKLVNLSTLDPPKSVLGVTDLDELLQVTAAHVPWERAEQGRTEIVLRTEFQTGFVFAVRAIDEAGAVEPFFDYERPDGGNAIRFTTNPESATGLSLVVTERTLGRLIPPPSDPVEIYTGTPLVLTLSASAEPYGGRIEEFAWAVDQDICNGPGCGWTGWSGDAVALDPIRIDTAGPHILYVQVRDDLGNRKLGSAVVTVVETPPFDREILLVDDYRDTVSPRDTEHDAFWTDILHNSGRFTEEDLLPGISRWHSHGANDAFFSYPVVPGLATFGRYKLVVYDTKGTGYDGFSGLLESGPLRKHLSGYLEHGGKLWITGETTIGAMLPTATDRGNFNYPHEITPDDFPGRFLKLVTERAANERYQDSQVHGLVAVEPFPGSGAGFPRMDLETGKQRIELRGAYGIGGCDAILDPIETGLDPEYTGVLEPLYVGRTRGSTLDPPRSSIYDGALNAVRWHDPDPDRTQGRTMWFGFPLYYFEDEQVQEVFNRAIDWFREEEPPRP